MVNILDLTKRNEGAPQASPAIPMEQTDMLSPRDMALTAAVVMPASFVWVMLERILFAIALGAAIYLIIEFVYPALRARNFYIEQLGRLYAHLRTLVRSRTAKQA